MFDFETVRETLPNLQRFHNRTERSFFKKLVWVSGAIVVLIGLATFGYREVRNWQQRRLSAEANALVDKGEYKRAGLEARRILQINPDSSEGVRILARIADRVGSRAALELRQRVVSSGAARLDDFFALARTAIRFGDVSVARNALEKVPAPAKNSAEYHAVAADIALTQRDGAATERELTEAARLDPANKEHVFRLAVLRLGAADPAVRDKARETLKELQNDKTFRREATRQLIRDALQRQDSNSALALAQQLNNFPDKDFRDRLTLLTVFYESKDSGFQNSLTELKKAAAQKPEEIGGLIVWLNTHGMSAEAIAWSKTVSAELLAQKSVPIALADAYITVHDWSSLERLTKNHNWGDADFLRMALHARAFREMGDMPKFTTQWNEAVKKVTPNAETVLMLSETAAKWGWRGEAIDLLWLAAKDSAKGEGALHNLYDYFVKSGDTQNLYRALLHLEELRPEDRDIQNNLAQVSLLLNLNIDHGQKLAHGVYEKEPKNATYVSTYAFALYTRGEAPKALKLFSGLTDAQLREPAIALYYGIILAAVGDSDRAAGFLDLAQKASLLPEEKALLEKARRSLAQR